MIWLADACAAEIEIRWPDAGLEVQTLALPGGHRFAGRASARAWMTED